METTGKVKRIRAALRVKHYHCNRDVKRILEILVNYMFVTLDRLTSERRERHWVAEELRLMTYAPVLGTLRKRAKRRSRQVHSIKLPLVADNKNYGLVKFWHEISKGNLRETMEKYCIVPLLKSRKDLKLIRRFVLEARKMSLVKINDWDVDDIDRRYWKDSLEKMKEIGEPFDEYLPLTETQMAIFNGQWPTTSRDDENIHDEPEQPKKKLKEEAGKRKNKKTSKRASKAQQLPRRPVKTVNFGPINNTHNWRQTKIDEYFNCVKKEP